MTCISQAHWCWTCRKEEDIRTIYRYIREVHEGYSVPGLGDEFDDEVDGTG
ncbi:hypothetical protein P280DRAFT_144999 [Massarina eburnea CBS 473.64]|uniref:Uncharacterized protein n=1 Tax=Massarina eburnea CBS 473.64 TaxID=1395130 RepID=A0A6A6RNR5_9PLEO|nr:hypothetical protein P280DRAFT_144999 [Massarina eburnea CBS 473.64]